MSNGKTAAIASLTIASLTASLLLSGCGEDQSGRTGNQGPIKFDGGDDGAFSDVEPGADVFSEAAGDAVAGDAGPDSDPDAAIPGCDFPPAGNDGAMTATPLGGPQVLREDQGDSQNLLDADFRSLPLDRVDVVGRSACGDLAVLLRTESGVVPSSLLYVDITDTIGAPETVESPTGTFDASLLFDSVCDPIVVRGALPSGYVQYQRTQPGQWSPSPAGLDLALLLGGQPTAFRHRWAQRANDGTLHVIAEADTSTGTKMIHGQRPGTPGAPWTFEAIDAVPGSKVGEYRVAPDGTIHTLYTTTTYPCSPCNLDLYHAERAPGGQWATGTVQASKWADPNDEFATTPSMVIDPAGKPWVAVTFQTRTTTGSLLSSDLRVYGRAGSGWCGESIVWSPDGYVGLDGPNFTGANPDIRIDAVGRLHVVFSDIAQWHDTQGYANHSVGQIRYVARSGKQWKASTLYTQAGPVASPQPLIGFDRPILALKQDATEFVVVGTVRIWDTNTVYNSTPVPLTLRAVTLRAAVSLP